MKILNLNISSSEIISEVKKTYLVSNFVSNCEIFKVEVIDGKEDLQNLIKKFKKFDKLPIQQQVACSIF